MKTQLKINKLLTPDGEDPGAERSANFGGWELPSVSRAEPIIVHISWRVATTAAVRNEHYIGN